MSPRAKVYSLYGLRLRSAVALPCPECPDTEDSASIELREATQEEILRAPSSPEILRETDGFWESWDFADGSARVCWSDHFEFHVSGDGSQILWRKLADVSNEVLFTYLLNQVLAYSLVAQGIEPLHASCVVIEGKAIALMADSGAGKSTLAAGFLRLGHPLLTDDALVLRLVGKHVLAYPSLPRLKLSSTSATALLGKRSSLPMNRYTDKLILPLASAERASGPAPLHAIFVLTAASEDSEICITRMDGHRALLPLMAHSFHTPLVGRRRLEQQFGFASRLADTVPIKALSYPRRLELLPAVLESLLSDLSQLELQ
jgi:hypothetical protein